MNITPLHDLPIVQLALLQQYRDIRHGVTTRAGGVSTGPYRSLNLGHKTGDQAACVRENRRRVCTAFGWKEEKVFTPLQVHGSRVVALSAHWARERGTALASALAGADGLITNVKGVGLMIKAADCVPVFFYDPVHRAIGLVHAGWRGAAQGIIGAAIDALRQTYGTEPDALIAGVGPGIGKCCFEVGEEVWDAFEAGNTDPSLWMSRGKGTGLFDLKGTIVRDLLRCGINPDAIEIVDTCTCCREDLFFSHRRDHGKTGRMGAFMGLVA